MAGGVTLSTYLRSDDDVFGLARKTLRATLAMTEGKHHLASVTTIQGDIATMLPATSNPAVLDIEANGARHTFQGYLDTGSVARKSGSGDNTLSIMGATSIMRSGTARAWTKARPHDIAAEVLAPYKLGLEFDYYDNVLDFFSQSESESDWQTLARIADKTGFSLVNEGAVVRFVDVVQEARRAVSVGYPTLVLPTTGSSTTNVADFHLLTSTTPPGAEYKNFRMVGTDALRQRFEYEVAYARGAADIEPEFDATHGGTFTSMGQAIIEARKVRRQARWTQTAKISCKGYRSFTPGRCVLLVDREGEYGGFWYVTDVLHRFDNVKNLSASEATLCRSERMQTPGNLEVSPHRPPSLRLVGGRWQCDRFWQKVV